MSFKKYAGKIITTAACATLFFAGALGFNSITAKAETKKWTVDLSNGRIINANSEDVDLYNVPKDYKDYIVTEMVTAFYDPSVMDNKSDQINTVLSKNPYQGISSTKKAYKNFVVRALDGSVGTGKYIISKDVILQRIGDADGDMAQEEAALMLCILDKFLIGDLTAESYAKPEDYLNLVFEIEIKYSDLPVITNNKVNGAPSVSFVAGKEFEDNGINYRIMDAAGNLSAISLASVSKEITIPDTVNLAGFNLGVTDIAQNFMKGNKKVKKVTVGSNVTSIGKEAFYKCKKLKKVTVKSTNITSFGKKAFGKDAKGFTLKMPKSCKKAYKKLLKKAKIKI